MYPGFGFYVLVLIIDYCKEYPYSAVCDDRRRCGYGITILANLDVFCQKSYRCRELGKARRPFIEFSCRRAAYMPDVAALGMCRFSSVSS